MGWQAVQSPGAAPATHIPASAMPSRPRPTSTPRPVPVAPDLAGHHVDEARRLVEALGLRLDVTEWRYDERVPALRVIAQDTPAGRQMFPGDVVAVTVSRGSARVTMPAVAGRSCDEAQVTLAQRGLAAAVTWVWHDQVPSQEVLKQSPAAGTSLMRGDRVHLTVSSGQTVRLHANLANQIQLTDADLPTGIPTGTVGATPVPRFTPGETIPLTLWWRAQTNINKDYVASVQVLDGGGQMVVQQDNPPGQRSTTLWLAGDVVRDAYHLRLPAAAPPGRYRILVSLYQAGVLQRLPVLDAQGHVVGDSVLVTKVLLVAP